LICPSFIATGIGRAALGGQGTRPPRRASRPGASPAPDDIAQRIVDALAQGRSLLLPDRTSRLAWWVHKFAPGFYARTMKRRVGAEFPTPSEETRS
jgi:hypothetical protein